MPARIITEPFRRIVPELTSRNEYFWRSGRDGVLRILWCEACRLYLHPPTPVCRSCGSMHVSPRPVSGRATVYSYTVNQYRYNPELEPPYVVAQVDLVEQDGLRLMTNIVGCEVGEVRIGMPVEVVFAEHDEVFVPLFVPVRQD
jgi:uncharacterized OB-fold protein